MTTEIQQFGLFLREHMEANIERLLAQISEAGPSYARTDHVQERVRSSYHVLAECIEREDMPGLVESSKAIGLERVQAGFGIQEVLNSIEILRDYIWDQVPEFLHERSPWSPALVRRLEDYIHAFETNVVSGFGTTLEQTRTELKMQTEELEALNQTVREIGTPIMPVHEGVLVLPLVGGIDSRRATQVMEVLLDAIATHQADLVIIDITGVPMVDTSVANYILQAARAARLVGAQIVLVGIGSEIAQTIVHLGVDLSDIITLANLQEGIQFAFEQLGISLVAHSALPAPAPVHRRVAL